MSLFRFKTTIPPELETRGNPLEVIRGCDRPRARPIPSSHFSTAILLEITRQIVLTKLAGYS
jgi:hypothetical protein